MNQEKFKGKYRISSARLQSWDYSSNGWYFITICTGDARHFFGEIVNGKMQLSRVGVLADVLWYEIKNHARVELGEFVVMPNHVHGILILDNPNNANGGHDGNDKDGKHNVRRDKACLVSTNVTNILNIMDTSNTEENAQPHPTKLMGCNRFQNQGKNTISSIVGSYKSAVTKHSRRLGFEFFWQSRFHDHIIRDEQSYLRIANYVVNNPRNWQDDCFYGSS